MPPNKPRPPEPVNALFQTAGKCSVSRCCWGEIHALRHQPVGQPSRLPVLAASLPRVAARGAKENGCDADWEQDAPGTGRLEALPYGRPLLGREPAMSRSAAFRPARAGFLPCGL
jgi:hypothetical protein